MRTVFLVHELPAWARNRARRAVKRPKLHMADTGLTAALLRLDAAALRHPNATMTGSLIETYVVNEITQQVSAFDVAIDLHHFRDSTGREVDLALEHIDGRIVAVDIKASASPAPSHVSNLAWLRDLMDSAEPESFAAGVLLHTGRHALKLGDRLYLLPIDHFWNTQGAEPSGASCSSLISQCPGQPSPRVRRGVREASAVASCEGAPARRKHAALASTPTCKDESVCEAAEGDVSRPSCRFADMDDVQYREQRPSVPGHPPEKPAAHCGTLHSTSKWGPHYCACGSVAKCHIEPDAATYKVCPKTSEVVWVGPPIKRRAGNKVVEATKSPRFKVGDEFRIADIRNQDQHLAEHGVDLAPRDAEPPPDDPDLLGDRLDRAARELLCGVAFLREIVDLLEDKGQVILYGPPGTGKTYFARRLAWALTDIADDEEYEENGPYSLVQFHPAYSYEDFFEGFRPAVDDDGNMTYRLTSGPLVRLAERAAENPGERHVMVIDEINRANLPRVLGELLYLLEYRDEWTQTQYRPVEGFVLPSNLWFIATMNTADRSIALIDAAMRRRFHFVPFFPNRAPTQGLLRRWTQRNAPEQAWVAEMLDGVNGEFEQALGGDHLLIGPSHFMKLGMDVEGLRRIWKYNIEPLIEDQLFGRQDAIDTFRFDTVWKRHGPGATSSGAEPDMTDGPLGHVVRPSNEDARVEGQGGE